MILALVPSRCCVKVAALDIDTVLTTVRPHTEPIDHRNAGRFLYLKTYGEILGVEPLAEIDGRGPSVLIHPLSLAIGRNTGQRCPPTQVHNLCRPPTPVKLEFCRAAIEYEYMMVGIL